MCRYISPIYQNASMEINLRLLLGSYAGLVKAYTDM